MAGTTTGSAVLEEMGMVWKESPPDVSHTDVMVLRSTIDLIDHTSVTMGMIALISVITQIPQTIEEKVVKARTYQWYILSITFKDR